MGDRSRKLLAALVLVGLVAGLGWHAVRDSAPSPAPSAPDVVPGGAGRPANWPTPAARPRPGSAASGASARAASEPGGQRQAPGAQASAQDEVPPEGIELCGVGRWTAEEIRQRGLPWLKAQMDRSMQQGDLALSRMASRLAAGTIRQQVAARLVMSDVEGAALLAAGSQDATAYQMALTSCGSPVHGPPGPQCQQLSIERWAALDPGDARPWLRLLVRAVSQRDEAAADAALAQVASRTQLSAGSFLLESQVAPIASMEPDGLAREHALVKVIGIDAAAVGFDMAGLSRACDVKHPAYSRRLPHCRAAAARLLAASHDLMDASFAQAVAARVGVPAAAQAHNAATLKAAMDAFAEEAGGSVGFDCQSAERLHRFSERRAAEGELGLALSLLRDRQAREAKP